jgi:hypothetical protein
MGGVDRDDTGRDIGKVGVKGSMDMSGRNDEAVGVRFKQFNGIVP